MADKLCVFCAIMQGQAPASLVYADDGVVSFMDTRPVNPGHVLVVPRRHVAVLADMEPALGSHLFEVGMRLAAALRQSGIRCEGVNLFLADGVAAGQEVLHVHLHILPRFRGDGFGFRFGPNYLNLPDRASLDGQAERIREAMQSQPPSSRSEA